MTIARPYLKTFTYLCADLAYRVGAFFVGSAPRVYILMYHSIENSTWKYGVAPSMFEQQLAYLRAQYTIVPLSDVVAYAKGECVLPDKTVAITFDDGYDGIHEHVLPLAVRHRVPFTVFLTTDLRELPVLGNLQRLTESQVADIAHSGVGYIEAHGHSHENLSQALRSGVDISADITTCKKHIERITGKVPRFFAYPSGHTSPGVVAIVEKLFDAAFGITEGRISQGDALYTLRRVQIDRTMSFLQFKLRVSGGIDVHRTIVDYVRHLIS